ncbi:MAG: hypothetical protein ACLUI3_17375 [Christensenellales bacterium]
MFELLIWSICATRRTSILPAFRRPEGASRLPALANKPRCCSPTRRPAP